jgi:transcriptional regulator with GAF, ATPase, and Fis domain
LRERLEADPNELGILVGALSERIAGAEHGAALAGDVLGWVDRELGATYAWPGNVRELEQCVRNVLVRRRYRPARPKAPSGELDRALLASRLGTEALLDRYAALVYRETESYVEAGRRLGLDRRTVKERAERGERALADD